MQNQNKPLDPNWIEPQSLTEAEERSSRIIAEVEQILRQLQARKAEIGMRGRVPQREWAEYLSWQQRANFAKSKMLEEQRRLKAWIRSYRVDHVIRRVTDVDSGEDDVRVLLRGSFNLMKRMRSQTGYKFDEAELALEQAIQAYLTHKI